MPRATWPLTDGKPVIEVIIRDVTTGDELLLILLADRGAGSKSCPFDLVLPQRVCLACGSIRQRAAILGGAYSGMFPLYTMPVTVKSLGFANQVKVVGVPNPPPDVDGIACFRFLNRFTYGNFGDADAFGLEC